jgi:hypothetical protein
MSPNARTQPLERISKGRKQPLVLHADNGNAIRAATLEARLEELCVLGSLSQPRVSNDNPYAESLFRTAKYRPDYPTRPFASAEEAGLLVASFADWYNHRHRHSGIKCLPPHHRRSGQGVEICRKSCCIRTSQAAAYPPVVTIHPLLGSTSGGLDQPSSIGTQHQFSYVEVGCLNGSRGVIFPGSQRV